MRTQADPAAALAEHPHILTAMAVLAWTGCLMLGIAVVVGDFLVPDHDWIADTISDLGAGRYEFIVDTGLYAYAAALIGCAVGASHAHLGGRGWTVGIYALIVAGLVVFLIGARDEYGDSDTEGVVIHIYLVYIVGVVFAVAPLSMASGIGRVAPKLARLSRATGVVWILAAPVFFFLPTDVDGLYERGLGGISLVFVVTLGCAFRARAVARRTSYADNGRG